MSQRTDLEQSKAVDYAADEMVALQNSFEETCQCSRDTLRQIAFEMLKQPPGCIWMDFTTSLPPLAPGDTDKGEQQRNAVYTKRPIIIIIIVEETAPN